VRLGIFGGTFNPIHLGHLRAAEEVRFKAGLDKIIFVPSGNPPLKSAGLIDAVHRFEMVKHAVSSNKNFVLSDIELQSKGKSYTVNTVGSLIREYAEHELCLILGIDAFLDIPNWKQPERLISLIDFVVILRPGFSLKGFNKTPYLLGRACNEEGLQDVKIMKLVSGRKVTIVETTPIGISSTEIRRLLKSGMSIKYLVPEKVEKYIIINKLFVHKGMDALRDERA
jgi:nicotinate-nucleotide adenylyltransferase